jgi:hypothetical protein
MHDDPGARQQSMQELYDELRQALYPTGKPQPARWPKALAAGAGAVILSVASWLGYQTMGNAVPEPTPVPLHSPTPTLAASVAAPPQLKLSLLAQGKNNQAQPVALDTVFRNSVPQAKSGGLRVAVKTEASGFIYLLEKNDKGQLAILHPHPKNPAGDSFLVAGQSVFLPNAKQWLRFNGAPGADVVFALFAPQKGEPLFAPIEKAIQQKKTVVETADADGLLAALTQRAEALTTGSNDLQERVVQGQGALVSILKLQHTK